MKRAFYDFSVSPYSYDFVTFLMCARSNGCDQVVFVPGQRFYTNEKGERVEYQKCTVAEQEYRLKNLLLPLCGNAIVCKTREEAKALWHEGCFPNGYTVEKPKAHHLFAHLLREKTLYPIMSPPSIREEVLKDVGPAPVVISIRETPYYTTRNSNIKAWKRVGHWLEKRGLNVVFVPDTHNTTRKFGRFKTYTKAAISILHRLALADIALLSTGVNSGNLTFAMFSRRPVLVFKNIDLNVNSTTPEFWQSMGIPVGSQFPWFTNLQRIVWNGEDDYENITQHLEAWFQVREGHGKWPLTVIPKFPVYGVMDADERGDHMLECMKHGFPKLEHVGSFHDKVLSLVCYGPSLEDTWQEIEHPIMSVSGAHDFLLSKGIVPDYHVECDPREYKTKLLKEGHPEVEYLMATCCHPTWWEKLKGQRITTWILHNGKQTDEWLKEHDPEGEPVGGGTTVGLRAMEVAARLGFRRFAIHGMDSSYRDENGQRHAGQHPGKAQSMMHVQCGNRWFWSSPQMIEAARELLGMLCKYDIEITLHGDGLQQAIIAESRRNAALQQKVA